MEAISFNPSINYSNYSVTNENYRPKRKYSEKDIEKIKKAKNRFEQTYNYHTQIANLKNEDLYKIARADASKTDKYKVPTYTAALATIPVVDTLVSGAFTKGPLSTKMAGMGRNALAWGGILALAGLYNGVVEKITEVVPVARKLEENHPIIKSILSIAGFVAVATAGQKGLSLLTKHAATHMPKLATKMAGWKAGLKTRINNSKLATKVYQPIVDGIKSFGVKHPKMANAGIATAALATPILTGGVLFKALTDKSEKDAAPTTKKCPFCCSDINISAVKCPQCTADLEKKK